MAPNYEKPKKPELHQALEKCLSDLSVAQQEVRALYAEGKVKRHLGMQGMWMAFVKFPNGFYNATFASETGPMLGFSKTVYTDDKYHHEIRELGYEIHCNELGGIDTYWRRTSHERLTFYPNGGIKRFSADIDDHTSGEASWDIDGKLQSEGLSVHPPRSEKGLPELEDMLRNGDNEKKGKAVRLMAEIGPASVPYALNVLKDGDEVSKERAAFLFALLGEKAVASVPELAQQFQKEKIANVRIAIARSLGVIGPSAKAGIPALEEAATNDVPEVASAAKIALERIRGPASK
jgi:hypothetical protein